MASSSFTFSDWPPALTNAQRAHLTELATTYALSHGLLYLPPKTDALPPPAPTREIIARQAGNLQCNIGRFTIVGALAAMQGTLTALSVKTAK